MHFMKRISFFCFGLCLLSMTANAGMLSENGMRFEQVDCIFDFNRTPWRNTVFEERKAGNQAKGKLGSVNAKGG